MCEEIRERVFELLRRYGGEMSAREIADALSVPYLHVYRALMRLAFGRVVEYRRVGKKLLLWRVKEV